MADVKEMTEDEKNLWIEIYTFQVRSEVKAGPAQTAADKAVRSLRGVAERLSKD
jgi:hypothetical protein